MHWEAKQARSLRRRLHLDLELQLERLGRRRRSLWRRRRARCRLRRSWGRCRRQGGRRLLHGQQRTKLLLRRLPCWRRLPLLRLPSLRCRACHLEPELAPGYRGRLGCRRCRQRRTARRWLGRRHGRQRQRRGRSKGCHDVVADHPTGLRRHCRCCQGCALRQGSQAEVWWHCRRRWQRRSPGRGEDLPPGCRRQGGEGLLHCLAGAAALAGHAGVAHGRAVA